MDERRQKMGHIICQLANKYNNSSFSSPTAPLTSSHKQMKGFALKNAGTASTMQVQHIHSVDSKMYHIKLRLNIKRTGFYEYLLWTQFDFQGKRIFSQFFCMSVATFTLTTLVISANIPPPLDGHDCQTFFYPTFFILQLNPTYFTLGLSQNYHF